HVLQRLRAVGGKGDACLEGGGCQVLGFERVARFAVPDQDRHCHTARRGQRRHLHTFLRPGTFHLVAMVLEPDLDLCRRETDEAGQVLALGRRQVLKWLQLLFKPCCALQCDFHAIPTNRGTLCYFFSNLGPRA
ncbi:mCG146261, partial [Mus musculus]